jgi:predicted RNA binding protein YcfA (HicA-like mRNA interferase family)
VPPRRLAFREVERKLLSAGFRFVGQKGSHAKYGKQTEKGFRTVVVPRHREVAVGTLRSILRRLKMSWQEFEGL